MRGRLATAIRRHVSRRFAYLSDTPLYTQSSTGVVRLAMACKRRIYQDMKRDLKRIKHNARV